MPHKTTKEKAKSFGFRVKIGEQEVELNGARSDVIKTLQELPDLVNNIQKAFEIAKPKTVATLTVKTQSAKEGANTQKQIYPQIAPTQDCAEAILEILKSEWGKWRPRTVNELKETLKTNGIKCAGRSLTKVLTNLVQKGTVRRWNTDAGFVFILAEKEALSVKGEAT